MDSTWGDGLIRVWRRGGLHMVSVSQALDAERSEVFHT